MRFRIVFEFTASHIEYMQKFREDCMQALADTNDLELLHLITSELEDDAS